MPENRRKIEKMNTVLESELTETVSEGEGEYDETSRENLIRFPFSSVKHRFSVTVFRDLARGRDSVQ